jgi:hypothetical protein
MRLMDRLHMPLEEQFYETSAARWKRELPWLRVFRAFRIAMDARKLVLALAGTLLYAAGMMLFTWLPFSPQSQQSAQEESPGGSADELVMGWGAPVAGWPWQGTFPGAVASRMSLPSIRFILYEPWEVGRPILHQARNLLAPWQIVVEPAHTVLFSRTWAQLAWGWTALLWALVVWAVFGGAIARIAALELAGEGAPSLREGLHHSVRFAISTMGATLLPVVGVGLFWGIAWLIGLVGAVPGVGPYVTGALWWISLFCGVVLAMILIGVAASWPLMYVTIAVEGSDAFDALSRSYNYVFSRPWYGLWLAALSLLYGAIVVLFLHGAMQFAVRLADHATAVGMGSQANFDLTDQVTTNAEGEMEPPSFAGRLRSMWSNGFMALSTVFVYSYFWVAMTIAYVLLRHAEDATPFTKVYWPVTEAAGGDPALSGMAAAEYRERKASSAATVVPPLPRGDSSAAESPAS